jgi:hypothetical protein
MKINFFEFFENLPISPLQVPPFLSMSVPVSVPTSLLLSPHPQGITLFPAGPLGGFGDFFLAELSNGDNTTIIAAAVKATYLPTLRIASFRVIFSSLTSMLLLFSKMDYSIYFRISSPKGTLLYFFVSFSFCLG